ncbi:MAG: VanW family protein [Anaerolineae bacterium]
MTTRQEAFGDKQRPGVLSFLPRVTLIIVTVLVLSNLAAGIGVAGYQIYHDGHIFPGVSVWDADLSGLTPEEALELLDGRFNYPSNIVITFRDGQNVWTVTAEQLGVQFDTYRTVQAAYEVGRHPEMLSSLREQATAWREGVVISPVIVYDQQFAVNTLNEIASQIDRPVVDATVSVNGFEAPATASQIGRETDVAATLALLEEQLFQLRNTEIEIVISETEPSVPSALEAANLINTILAGDLEVYIEEPLPGDPGPWYATRDALAEMLIIELVPAADGETQEYSVRLNEEQLRSFLSPLAGRLEIEPINARFIFTDNTGEIEPITASQTGRRLDMAGSIQVINAAAASGSRQVPLVFETVEPGVPDTATGEDLGIVELVSSATTYFAGSSSARRVNVEEAAGRFNGVVIEPNSVFSFNEWLGDVSTDSGFEEALIIHNGRTFEGVGGGVCQVSTTAFQAAFYAGFPILERVPHAYRVGYYEVGEGLGMDATVYSPIVDLKFQNDLNTYLLVETSVDTARAQVTFRFYSTSDGRTVQKDGPYVTNQVPHGPAIYEENPELAPGQTKQVDYAVDGADVTVYRIVYRDGEILYQDTFFSQYIPWQAIFQVAPGYAPYTN